MTTRRKPDFCKLTDGELRELLHLYDGERATPVGPHIEPIRLAENQIDNFLNRIPFTHDENHDWRRRLVRKELAEAAEGFCSDYYFQKSPSPSATRRKLESIQAAARKLLQSLGPWDNFPKTIESDVQSYLRMAAEEYGVHAGLPTGVSPHDIPWNFWPVYKLPSAVSGIRLIEHWAQLAMENLGTQIRENKRTGRTGNLGYTAVRVLIHRLVLAWLHASGEAPGAGVNAITERADGPFIRFAADFLKAMSQNLTDAQRIQCKGIENSLSISPDAIRPYVRAFKRRLVRRPRAVSSSDIAKVRSGAR